MAIAGMTPTLYLPSGHDAQLAEVARASGWQIVSSLRSDDELVVACALAADTDLEPLRQAFPLALVVREGESAAAHDDVDLSIAANADEAVVQQMLRMAADHWHRSKRMMELARDVATRKAQTRRLSEIGLSLSRRGDVDTLLETILTEARSLVPTDGASLYLVADDRDGPELLFKLAQNDSISVPFLEQRLPMTRGSVAGFVALTGNELNLADVYKIPPSAPYRFNASFDEQMGYRTRSMLVIPMRDHRDNVVGVLQFINRTARDGKTVTPFAEEDTEMLRAIASQAAVSIQKNALIDNIKELFESFVHASVKAIEQRDPSTSGHSFRVAQTTVELLQALPKSGISRFQAIDLSEDHLREVRYAALLHDFGKVSVRESVLLKANKLTDERLEIVRYRVELQKERLRRRAVERQLHALHHGNESNEVTRARVQRQLERELSLLDDYLDAVTAANRPNVSDSDRFDHLYAVREYAFRELDGTLSGLITDADLVALSVPRGSLTREERQEIQSHVAHTIEFLSVLPWPSELGNVTAIAGAHHEKLDGSGYPYGMVGDEIPLASRVMTVCDIYDALTAMDRPYKPAMSPEVALNILADDVRRGLLDGDIVETFAQARVWRCLDTGVSQAI